MKLVLALIASFVVPMSANAGDNGSYTKCSSSSGRTKLVFGNVGGGDQPNTVELTIDGQSLGAAEIGESVFEKVDGPLTVYTEADHFAQTWVAFVESNKAAGKITIVDGLDPRTGKALEKNINLYCKVVYNPI